MSEPESILKFRDLINILHEKYKYSVDKLHDIYKHIDISLFNSKNMDTTNENCFNCKNCKNCINCYGCVNCENCYGCVNCVNCINLIASVNCISCGDADLLIDSKFSKLSSYCTNINRSSELTNCKNCILCNHSFNCTNCINCDECNDCINCNHNTNCIDCTNCNNHHNITGFKF